MKHLIYQKLEHFGCHKLQDLIHIKSHPNVTNKFEQQSCRRFLMNTSFDLTEFLCT